MTTPLPSDDEGRIDKSAWASIERQAEWATCIACGPGIGRSGGLNEIVGAMYRSVARPMVVDADALNALSESPHGFRSPGGPRILTPHPGEFRRMLAASDSVSSRDEMQQRAASMASDCGAVIVLKGHRTFVTDGKHSFVNKTGNPGMATGGTGDVLTGIITALVCQGLSPVDAARLGVFIHGLAGDIAAQQLGQTSMIARDLIWFLPDAFACLAS